MFTRDASKNMDGLVKNMVGLVSMMETKWSRVGLRGGQLRSAWYSISPYCLTFRIRNGVCRSDNYQNQRIKWKRNVPCRFESRGFL